MLPTGLSAAGTLALQVPEAALPLCGLQKRVDAGGVSVEVPLGVTKHHDQKQLKKEKVYFTYILP